MPAQSNLTVKVLYVDKQLKAVIRRITIEPTEPNKPVDFAKHALTLSGEWLLIPEGTGFPPETWLPVSDMGTVFTDNYPMDPDDIAAKWAILNKRDEL